uniref:BED-type domain-containing protein n=1 Tax=Scophthalmus maximus TaxID=52904 RepID=A0A8D3AL83_SCOMX
MDLISKPRSKSIVWLYFGLKADEKGQPLNSVEAVCRLCRKIVLAKGGNTTNLRSHLRRRHRADFLETSSSTTSGVLFDTPGFDLNHEEFFEDLPFLQNASNQNYVPDAVLPPGEPWLHGGPSRAALSLPSCLCLCGDIESRMSGPGSSGKEQMGDMKVYARCHLQQGVLFGPFVGEICRGQMPSNLKYTWAIRDDAAFIYVDASDENASNWMRYVTYTSSEEEHNLYVFQFYRHIYYRVSQPITEGAELRVWIGKDYASLLGLGMGPQRSQPMLFSSGLVSTLPLVMPAQVTNAIANFLIRDLQPPAVVEGEGFRQLVHTLLPSCKELPSPSQLENYLKEHHTKGKVSLAQMLRRKTGSGENEDLFDYTAPIEVEPRRRGRPTGHRRQFSHFVTLSVDVWSHNWQGNSERYLTLWAHCIDSSFSCKNLALATQRLTESRVKDDTLRAVEAQVKVMAQEWGISQPHLVLLGGERRNRVRPGTIKREKGEEAAAGLPHPNSTTFLERDDSLSPEEPLVSEYSHPSEGLPSVPCFFSAVQECVEEVMSHPVISKTLCQFQGILSILFLPPAQNRGSYLPHVQSLLQNLTRQEQAELQSWAHCRPTWNKLFPLLSTLIKHKILVCDVIKKEIIGEGLSKGEPAPESSSSGSCHANSTSSTSSSSITMRSEWKVLEELCLVLRPLDVACRTLAKEAFPRLSLIKPILTGLLSRHLVSRPGDSSSILKEVKRTMRQNLASCYNNPVVNRALCVACSLDPQFHGLGFMEQKEQTATFCWLKKEAIRIVKEDSKRSKAKSHIKRSPSPFFPESDSDIVRRSKRLRESRPINFKEDEDDDEESDIGDADENESADPGSLSGLSGMEFLLGDLFSSAPRSRQSSVEESIDMEMSVFRADKGASLGVEPLQWWRTKAVQFPLLASVARAYLAAPAVAGNTVQDFMHEGAGAMFRKRANIPPESLDAILFLHHNHMATTDAGQTSVRNDVKSGIEKVP